MGVKASGGTWSNVQQSIKKRSETSPLLFLHTLRLPNLTINSPFYPDSDLSLGGSCE